MDRLGEVEKRIEDEEDDVGETDPRRLTRLGDVGRVKTDDDWDELNIELEDDIEEEQKWPEGETDLWK